VSGGPRESATLGSSAQRVQDALQALGLDRRVFELAVPVRTAADAAREVGCEVAQICKSLVFRGETSGRALLVIASGAHRVDETRVAAHFGEPIGKADPAFVREHTGYAIGGVPPVGHREPLDTLIDDALLAHTRLWAAAGHPNALFELTPDELTRIVSGRVVSVA
jgi:prolyl-tRNA editing enzyme YbaK/EbsC (Cys-tRNA(Pro) deacylase)